MIKSMTGYGRFQQIIDGRDILVEIKSVNHRYFEFSSRVPRVYGYLEEKLKSFVQQEVSRGKIDVSVSVYTVEGKDAEVEINKSLASGYVDALRGISKEFDLNDDLSLSTVSRLNDIFNVRKAVEDVEVIWNSVKIVATKALQDFIDMRVTEGQKMKEDVKSRLNTIEQIVEKIEERSPQTVKEYRERLYNKMMDILSDTKIDEQRILMESAIFAEKVGIDEETVRLRSHLKQIDTMLQSADSIGRKLDFIVQELNREINTIGSKAQDIEIAYHVVNVKAEIEKIREQIQNIE
ncbi:MAG: hypothetical protein K0R90_126 [Oscillospiraceae bacterium]|nr:hypothetical protein [Oscillospiraceae bacterium]